MEKIGLVFNSTVYLDNETLEEFNVKVVPLNILESDNTYKETAITPEFVIDEIDHGHKVTTAQPSPDSFLKAYETLFEEGYDKILTLVISRGLSGTYQSAELAKDLLEKRGDDVHVLDTLNAGFGNELIAKAILTMVSNNESFESIISKTDEIASKTGLLFTVSSLFHLQRGGRLSKTNALIGTVLRIKPIIRLNDKGELKPVHRERTVTKLIKYVINTIKNDDQGQGRLHVHLVEQRSEDTIERIITALKENFENPLISVNHYIGPVFAIHIGKKGYGIAWYRE
ncbi:MAG: DegV family protein [Bacillota bacterium]